MHTLAVFNPSAYLTHVVEQGGAYLLHKGFSKVSVIALELLPRIVLLGSALFFFSHSFTLLGVGAIIGTNIYYPVTPSIEIRQGPFLALPQAATSQELGSCVRRIVMRYMYALIPFAAVYILGGVLLAMHAAPQVYIAYRTQQLASFFFYLSISIKSFSDFIREGCTKLFKIRKWKKQLSFLIENCQNIFNARSTNTRELPYFYLRKIVEILFPHFFTDHMTLRLNYGSKDLETKEALEEYVQAKNRWMPAEEIIQLVSTFELKLSLIEELIEPQRISGVVVPYLEKDLFTDSELAEMERICTEPVENGSPTEIANTLKFIDRLLIKITAFEDSFAFLERCFKEKKWFEESFGKLLSQQELIAEKKPGLISKRKVMMPLWLKMAPKENPPDGSHTPTCDVIQDDLLFIPERANHFMREMDRLVRWEGIEPEEDKTRAWQTLFQRKGIGNRSDLLRGPNPLFVTGNPPLSLDNILIFLGGTPFDKAKRWEKLRVIGNASKFYLYVAVDVAIYVFNACIKGGLIGAQATMHPHKMAFSTLVGLIHSRPERDSTGNLSILWRLPPRYIPSVQEEATLLHKQLLETAATLFFSSVGSCYAGYQMGKALRFYLWSLLKGGTHVDQPSL